MTPFIAIVFFLLLLASPSWAATFHVGQNISGASDSHNCTNATTQACLTINKGAGVLGSGDMLLVHTGTYDERLTINSGLGSDVNWPGGPNASSRTTIAAYPGNCQPAGLATPASENALPSCDVVTWRPPSPLQDPTLYQNYIGICGYRRVTDFVFDGRGLGYGTAWYDGGCTSGTSGDYAFQFDHNIVKNYQGGLFGFYRGWIHHNDMSSAPGTFGQNCMYVTGSFAMVERNAVHNCASYGIQVWTYGNQAVTVRGNRVFGASTAIVSDPSCGGSTKCGGFGIVLGNGPNHQAYNNIIHDWSGGIYNAAIQISTGAESGCTNCAVFNNTIFNNQQGSISVDASASGIVIQNNIAFANSGNGDSIHVDVAGSFTADHNLIGIDPGFTNPGTGDFTLSSISSPAVDTGVNLSSLIPAVDFIGTTRPQGKQWDIGAYEFGATSPPPTIAITSPTALGIYVTTTNNLIASGTMACPSSSVLKVEWLNDLGGGGTANISGGTWTFTGSGLDLTDDALNTVTVTVTCVDKTTASAQLKVPYSVPALVGAWAFDENAGTTPQDSSGKNNHGSFGAGVAWTTNGKYGNALTFSGGSFTVPNSASLGIIGGFTIVAQAMPDVFQTDFRSILVKNYDYYLYATVGKYCGDGFPLGGYSGGANVCNPSALPINIYSCVAITYDGVNEKMYVNKGLVQTQAVSALPQVSGGTLQIGGSQFGEFFHGNLDNIQLFNFDIGQSGINTACDTGINPPPAPVTALKMSAASPIMRFPAGTVLKLPGQ